MNADYEPLDFCQITGVSLRLLWRIIVNFLLALSGKNISTGSLNSAGICKYDSGVNTLKIIIQIRNAGTAMQNSAGLGF
ncbi:MAG: hypothetical protein HC910_20705 [Spirulinaceae cyanobacterium SM2_1_0]|nr:hypothetical protein [Spirulinaceae cyanobacterium SM2_1_0]